MTVTTRADPAPESPCSAAKKERTSPKRGPKWFGKALLCCHLFGFAFLAQQLESSLGFGVGLGNFLLDRKSVV